MIGADEPFVCPPRISREQFAEIIKEHGAPRLVAERDPGEYWDAIAGYGVDPLFLLAMFQHESGLGQFGVAVRTQSWGNTRSPTYGATPAGQVGGKTGMFPVFGTWLDGCVSTAARLVEPSWVYADRATIREVFEHPSGQVWAPAGDLNDPAGYLRSMLDVMNRWASAPAAGEPGLPMVDRLTPINHWAGRRGHMVKAIVLHITDGDTLVSVLSWFNTIESGASAHYVIDRDGGIYRVVAEEDTAWTSGWDFQLNIIAAYRPDLDNPIIRAWYDRRVNPNLETVTIEAVGRPRQGWTDAQVDSAALLVDAIAERHGFVADRTTVIGHYQLDSIHREYCPSLTADQWSRVLGTANSGSRHFRETGQYVAHGFLAYWEALGDEIALRVLGLPLTGERMETCEDGAVRVVQWFERACLEYHPDAAPGWEIQLRRLGALALAATAEEEAAPSAE